MAIKKRNKTRREFIKQSVMAGAMLPLLFSCGQNSRSTKSSFDPSTIKKLRNSFSGQIIVPGDPDYELKRWSRVKNQTTDRHPALIASCKKEEDIVRSIDFANQYKLEIAVRSGNHSSMSWGTCEGGMVIDLSQMKGITVDQVNKTAIVTTGSSAEEILAATAPYGLAPVLGQCGSVGSGVALGGGLGWLAGKYGATCDNLLSANVITADAELLKANASTNEDLYWAIRGGGGNFGVASTFKYQLHAVNEILGGKLVYTIENVRPIVTFFNEFMSNAPDELQADCYLTQDRCWVQFVFFGNLDEGERLINNFRKFSKPDQDSVKRRHFSEVYTMDSDGPSVPVNFRSVKGTYIPQITDEVISLMLNQLTKTPRMSATVFNFSHFMHGEVCRILSDSTAFELRNPGAAHLLFYITWQDSADSTVCIDWDNETFEQLQAYSGGRIYANYMSVPGGPSAKAVFGSNLSRLSQIKKKYDPNNIFHLNQNIIPS